MRVLTYNIHGWADAEGVPNLERVADVLAASGADIIGLNEVFHPYWVEGDTRPALDTLAARLGMAAVFGPAFTWPAHHQQPPQGYGNALLARWPIDATAVHHIRIDGFHARCLFEGRVALPGGDPLTVYVIHLDHTDEETRVQQFRHARQWLVRDRNRPHLLMGDMNATSPWDFADRPADLATLAAHPKGSNLVGGPGGGLAGMRALPAIEKAGYVDLQRQLGAPGARSYVRAEIDLRIDYIFASAPLAPRAVACGIIADADTVSDHRPVWADVDL